MALIARILSGTLAMIMAVAPAIAGETFVVTGEALTSSSNPKHSVRLGERIPVAELKARFKGYTVQSTAGEDCLFCATVYTYDVGFEVNYDETGVVVTSVVCNQGCSDALGNEVGGQLRAAVGDVGNCDAGYYTTCLSPRIGGLVYILSDEDSCPFEVSGEATAVPSCAEIAGFVIEKR